MRKYLSILILIISLILIGCVSEEPKELKTYNVVYNLNGGSCDEIVEIINENEVYILPKPIKDDYEFIGWYQINDDGSEYCVTVLYNNNYNLVAKWKEVFKEPDLTPNISTYRDELTTYKNITYKVINGEELKLDLYMPPLTQSEYENENKRLPVLFFYYGGGWIFGSKEDIPFLKQIIDAVLNAGFVVVAPNYRLCNKGVSYPSPVEDALDAVRYVVKYQDILGIDVNNMGTIGYSAGGHLATMVGFAQDYFKAYDELSNYSFKIKYVVDMYGPSYYDMSELTKLSALGKIMLTSYLGTLNYNDIECEKALPSYYVNYNNPKVFIVHGLADSLVPVSQSQKFYALLQESNIESTVLYVYGADHVLNAASGYSKTNPQLSDIYTRISDFIIAQK